MGKRLCSGPAGLLWASALLVAAQPVVSAVIVVQGGCTLVDAINSANTDAAVGGCPTGLGADTIVLTADVTLSAVADATDGFTGLPAVTTNITIQGDNHQIARDGASPLPFRIFLVKPAGNLTINRVSVTGGFETLGGAFKNDSGSLTIKNSAVFSNEAAGSGGAIYNAGVMGDNAVLNISRTVLSLNRAINDVTLDVEGGVLFNSFFGVAVIEESTFESNTVGNLNHTNADGGAIWNQAGGVLSINRSTFVGNASLGAAVSFGRGAAIRNRGDDASGGDFTVTNSTFSGNVGVGADGAAIYNSGDAFLNHLTFSGNSPNAIDNTTGAVATLQWSILANSIGGDNCVGSAIGTLVANQADDSSCGFGASLTGLDSNLADNGGPTQTHALLSGSSAINVIPSVACIFPVDQRGAPRVGNCDVGAFEFMGCPDLVLADDTITTAETYEECSVTLGLNLSIQGPSGNLTVRSGTQVLFTNEVSVGLDGKLAVEIDPSLQLLVSELIEADRARRRERVGLER